MAWIESISPPEIQDLRIFPETNIRYIPVRTTKKLDEELTLIIVFDGLNSAMEVTQIAIITDIR